MILNHRTVKVRGGRVQDDAKSDLKMKKALSLTFFSVFLLSLGALFLTKPSPLSAYAPNQDTASFEENVYGRDEFNNESHSYATTENIIQSLNNMILGCATDACTEKLAAKGLPTNGAVGATSNLIASLYTNPPASSAYYLADLSQRLNLTQPAYAQGIGFSGLTPLLPLWRAARNAAYIFFIFVFLVIGFAIMFRAKINPQTVVTIQSAIPKAVVALILVTFSYAIAGLMIDLMYVVGGISLAIVNPTSATDTIFEFLKEHGLMEGEENLNFLSFMTYFWSKTHSVTKDIGSLFSPVGPLIKMIPEGTLKDVAESFPGAFFISRNPLIEFVLSIIMLFVFFKIFLGLILCYAKIIINIIIAPLTLMLGAIPGQNSFGGWLKNLAVNLLPFPAVISLIALAGELTKMGDGANPLWAPPILRPPSLGLDAAQTVAASYVGSFLALGILLLAARVPDIIKSMFEKKPFEYGTALGESMKKPFAVGGKLIKGTGQVVESAARLKTSYRDLVKTPTTEASPEDENTTPNTSGASN